MSSENERRHVFISHHHADDATVSDLTSLLSKKGYDIRNSSVRAKPANQERLKNGLIKDEVLRRLLRMKISWAGKVVVGSCMTVPLQPTRRLAWLWYADRMKAAEKYGADYVRDVEARIGRLDLFLLLVRLLRRPDLNKDWLFERCREVQANPNGYLDLWAREHGKSSIITFGLTIQDILNDP